MFCVLLPGHLFFLIFGFNIFQKWRNNFQIKRRHSFMGFIIVLCIIIVNLPGNSLVLKSWRRLLKLIAALIFRELIFQIWIFIGIHQNLYLINLIKKMNAFKNRIRESIRISLSTYTGIGCWDFLLNPKLPSILRKHCLFGLIGFGIIILLLNDYWQIFCLRISL